MATDAEVDAIRRSVDLVAYVGQYLELKKAGAEYRALCPFHPDRNPSLSINGTKQVWACFACGAHEQHGADLFGFVRSYFDCTFPEAITRLQNGNGAGDHKPIIRPPLKQPPPRKLLIPPAGSLPELQRGDLGVPIKVWTICTPEGAPWLYEARYMRDGQKETRYFSFGRYADADPPRWECKHPTNPRPFYGLEQLAQHPTAWVWIHEAPKKAEAAALLFPGRAHLGMLGGANAARYMDVEPLKGKRIVLLPDNDQPGREAMYELGTRLKPLVAELKRVDPSTQPDGTDSPPKWDIADATDWTPDDALAWAKARTTLVYAAPHRTEAPDAGHPGGSSPASPAPGASPKPDQGAHDAPGRAVGEHESPAPADRGRAELAQGDPAAASAADTLIRDAKGNLKACEHNAKELLAAAHQYDALRFDDFLYRPRIEERDWSDHDERDALCWLQAKFQTSNFTLAQVRTAAAKLAYDRRADSLAEFVLNLPAWDRTERIEHALIDAWGADDTALTRAASRNFFLALHARAVKPGAQVDNLWVLEGPQGTLKSASLRALGQHFHAEISASVGTADFLRELRGIWIAELSELDSLRGREASTVKRLLSAPSDRFVDKYDRHAVAYARRAVVVATTNEANYWQDSTGARRLIPIRCGAIRIDLIEALRLQWFAEARQAFTTGATWWEWPAMTAEEQEARQIVDPWEDTLRAAMDSPAWPTGWVGSAQITADWLKLDAAQQGRAVGVRLGQVMRRLGYIPTQRGHGRARGWKPLDRPEGAETKDAGT